MEKKANRDIKEQLDYLRIKKEIIAEKIPEIAQNINYIFQQEILDCLIDENHIDNFLNLIKQVILDAKKQIEEN